MPNKARVRMTWDGSVLSVIVDKDLTEEMYVAPKMSPSAFACLLLRQVAEEVLAEGTLTIEEIHMTDDTTRKVILYDVCTHALAALEEFYLTHEQLPDIRLAMTELSKQVALAARREDKVNYVGMNRYLVFIVRLMQSLVASYPSTETAGLADALIWFAAYSKGGSYA